MITSSLSRSLEATIVRVSDGTLFDDAAITINLEISTTITLPGGARATGGVVLERGTSLKLPVFTSSPSMVKPILKPPAVQSAGFQNLFDKQKYRSAMELTGS